MTLTLLTRPGCHLCDAMKAVVEELSLKRRVSVEEIDITGRADLDRRFGREIPVLMLGDEVVATTRTTTQALLKRLNAIEAEA